jgi:hypothetical protein
MRLAALLMAAMLIAWPALAQQPAGPEASLPDTRGTQDAVGEGSTSSTPSVDAPSASIGRVRAALEKPAAILTPPDRTADFSIHIEQRVPLQEIFDTPPWRTSAVAPGWGPVSSSTPLVSFDVLPLLLRAKRAYAEHNAREEVKHAIADYCAAQPKAGAATQICTNAPAAR